MYSTIKKLSQVIDKRLKETSDDTLRKGMEILQNLKERVLSNRYLVSLLPADWEDLYPVSPIQMGMFLYTKMYPDVPMYLEMTYGQNNKRKRNTISVQVFDWL